MIIYNMNEPLPLKEFSFPYSNIKYDLRTMFSEYWILLLFLFLFSLFMYNESSSKNKPVKGG